jgi:DNA-binding response OmpR family regulator
MANILIVEDERAINDLIMINLRHAGHTAIQAFDAREAVAAVANAKPDLALLDVMLPHTDGFSLMEQNAFNGVPVIFLTAKGSTEDKVKGLKLGADDYIAKPFETSELLARVEAVLRRAAPTQNAVAIENTIIYLDRRIATVRGESIDLTNQEFALLEVLIRNRNIALSREKLIELAWGYDFYGDSRTVDVHITRLRKKLALEAHIQTVYRLGYRFQI